MSLTASRVPGAIVYDHTKTVVRRHVAPGPLDQRADRRPVQPDDQVALPVTRHGPIGGLGRPFARQRRFQSAPTRVALSCIAPSSPFATLFRSPPIDW